MSTRAHHRQAARHAHRARTIAPDHGQVAFLLEASGRPRNIIDTPGVGSLFPGFSGDFDVKIGLAARADLLLFATAAYDLVVSERPTWAGATPGAARALVRACCEHIRDDVLVDIERIATAAHAAIPPDLRDEMVARPTAWLCWAMIPVIGDPR